MLKIDLYVLDTGSLSWRVMNHRIWLRGPCISTSMPVTSCTWNLLIILVSIHIHVIILTNRGLESSKYIFVDFVFCNVMYCDHGRWGNSIFRPKKNRGVKRRMYWISRISRYLKAETVHVSNLKFMLPVIWDSIEINM